MSNQIKGSASLRYRDSGVSVDAGNQLIEKIKPAVLETARSGVLQGIGGFGALFEIPVDRFKKPVLVSGTDGVGTKLKLATMLGKHDTIGIDLVAMCVNDIVTCGAEPLYFLDYFATAELNPDLAESVIRGIARGCILAGCALTGGETAEMPGMYSPGDYDLAGFSVGIVEKNDIILPERVRVGDNLLGLASSGIHSNGFSLVRKIIEVNDCDLNMAFDDSTLGEKLLTPTRIYVKSILALVDSVRVSAICHITGGGIIENVPRGLPEGLGAQISSSSWKIPQLFQWLQKNGNIDDLEMRRTFNCGIGMTVCVAPEDTDAAIDSLRKSGEEVYPMGEIVESGHKKIIWKN